ncbi:carboxypeptidase regulatory-like domain-containing protein [Clostridium sp. 'White wine YQ']|uniref:carboxypeptidase regulatory-like domain-containing protein n=1 Tax=Clostridium sp. 'White wine YQ' TaxID=3027474 RepID=UPI002365938D|nr:carboxypeptidase regulatory-like domain-containing protein [Clostridium sp. 'White wine YQ']MDD7794505.1 carboxypeptidase regulatory-like domain-containing protein [Clostridium sp. 'White wine YQ']
MKQVFKRFVIMLGLAMLVVSKPSMALAQTTEKDNLKVKFEVEQVQNSSDEAVGKVKITNVGIRPIDDISIESILPEGIKLKEGSALSKKVGSLEAGESVNYEFYGKLESSLSPGSSNPAPGNGGEVNNPSTNSPGGISKDVVDSVKTGDDNLIASLVVLIVICSGLIVLLSRKKIKGKKALSIFICATLGSTLIGNSKMVQAAGGENKKISVKENIIVNQKSYTLETVVSYKIQSDVVVPSGNVISRGQWISMLMDTIALQSGQQLEIDDTDNIFNDIEGNQYKEAITKAAIHSIIGAENGAFRPNEPATREFAAVTAVRAANFQPVKNIVCDDANEITSLKEVEAAVSMDIINLDKNKFYPSRSLTQSEAQYVLEGIKAVLKSTAIDPNYDNNIQYKDGVIELKDDVSYKVNGTIVTFDLNDKTKNLKKDDVFILPDQTPYKASSVTIEGNKVIVDTVEPKIEETLEYIDAQGYGTVDMSRFIPEEGVGVAQTNTSRIITNALNVNEGGSISGPGEIKLTVDKELQNKMKLAGEVSIKIPEVLYKADVDVGLFNIDVNNVYLKFKEEAKATGKVTLFSDEGSTPKKDGFIELGKVPIVGIPGVAIYAEIGLGYTFEGEISVSVTLKGELGAQVLNNHLRAIKDINLGFDGLELNAKFKMGPRIKGLLEVCSRWDLIDFSAFGGGAADATGTLRDNGLICLDASIYVFAELSALDEGIIGDWLNLGYTWEIYNKENSPIKRNYHFENLQRVPQCTYGAGTINGMVSEAGNRSSFVEGALIEVRDPVKNKVIKTVTSDANGQYSVKLQEGTYNFVISKDGYISFGSQEAISKNEVKYVQTYLMVAQGHEGEEGIAGGKITNALTGENISDISIKIRKGWNNLSGNVVTETSTNQNGEYQAKLTLGNYTVEMIKEGYVTNSYNIYVASGSALNQNNTLVPDSTEIPAGDLRMVLTWGEQPRDLDSHLVGSTADGSGNFNIYYGNKKYSKDGVMYADLDLDDTTSYGPETTSIYKMNSDSKYSFYVHDYTNRGNSSSTAMSNSGAKVEVYKGNKLCVTYSIPTNKPGCYWHVFDYDAKTNRIIPVNSFVNGIVYGNANAGISARQVSPLPRWEVEEKKAN